MNLRLQEKLARIVAHEQRWECYRTDDAESLIVAFGTVGRIARSAVDQAREQGRRVGLFRPISLWPFPAEPLAQLSRQVQSILVAEMNAGQMREDVERVVRGPVHFVGRMGGMIPTPEEIVEALPAPAKPHIPRPGLNGMARRNVKIET